MKNGIIADLQYCERESYINPNTRNSLDTLGDNSYSILDIDKKNAIIHGFGRELDRYLTL